ncbi:MAG: hypothetical protein Kow0070_29260 [Anaerolineales bacterium]
MYDLIEYKREGEYGLILSSNENAILFPALLLIFEKSMSHSVDPLEMCAE